MLWKSPSRARGRDFWIWNYGYDGLRNSPTCQSENARFPICNWPRIASRDSAQTRRNEQEKITQTHAARSTNYSQLFHKAKSHAFAASKMRISRWFRAFCANCASTPERDQKNAEASVCGNPPRALDTRSLRESPNPFLRAREPIGKPRNSRRGETLVREFPGRVPRSLLRAVRAHQSFEIGKNPGLRLSIAMDGPVQERTADHGLHGIS